MKRVGYDADTQRYTFQQGRQLWIGEPGCEYGGNLTRAGTVPGKLHPSQVRRRAAYQGLKDEDELEGDAITFGRSDGYQQLPQDNVRAPVGSHYRFLILIYAQGARPVYSNHNAYRMFLPYMLLIAVFLLFVWRFIVGHSAPIAPPQERMCPGGPNVTKHHVRDGDTCWKVAQSYNTTVDALLDEALNPGLECDRLRSGDVLCVPTDT
jgi:LysM domain